MEKHFLLGQMLIDDNLISQAQLDQALQYHRKYKKPLGEVLVGLKILDVKTVQEALKRQRSIKMEECTKVGAILVQSKAITYFDLFGALEHQARVGGQIGDILLKAGKISKSDLGAALKAQKMYRSFLGKMPGYKKAEFDAFVSEYEAAYQDWLRRKERAKTVPSAPSAPGAGGVAKPAVQQLVKPSSAGYAGARAAVITSISQLPLDAMEVVHDQATLKKLLGAIGYQRYNAAQCLIAKDRIEKGQFHIIQATSADWEMVASLTSNLKDVYRAEHKDSSPVVKVHHVQPVLIESIAGQTKGTKSGDDDVDSEAVDQFKEFIKKGLEMGCSDIHMIQHEGRQGVVEFRINGELHTIMEDMTADQLARIVRAAYNSDMTTSKGLSWNPREMCDGAMTYRAGGVTHTMRFHSYPHRDSGNHAVLRFLSKTKDRRFIDHEADGQIKPFDLELMGYSRPQVDILRIMMGYSNGLIVICGKTNSGKTTLLNALVTNKQLETKFRKRVITAEDPVETNIPRAVMSPVNPKAGQTYAQCLKSILRRDGDIVIVGEIRDEETGSAVIEAGTGGHLVLATLHCETVISAIDKMVERGIPRRKIASPDFLRGIVAQKLVKTLCPHCKIPIQNARKQGLISEEAFLRTMNAARVELNDHSSGIYVRNDKGCDQCLGGISGRTVVCEMLLPDHMMLEMIRKDNDLELFHYWRGQGADKKRTNAERYLGMTRMDQAILKMKQGLISPSDIEESLELMTVQGALDDRTITETEMEGMVQPKPSKLDLVKQA